MHEVVPIRLRVASHTTTDAYSTLEWAFADRYVSRTRRYVLSKCWEMGIGNWELRNFSESQAVISRISALIPALHLHKAAAGGPLKYLQRFPHVLHLRVVSTPSSSFTYTNLEHSVSDQQLQVHAAT